MLVSRPVFLLFPMLAMALATGCREAKIDYDFDGDGVDDEDDCEPQNADVFPGNMDICGDGVDVDCDSCGGEHPDGAGDGIDGDCDGFPADPGEWLAQGSCTVWDCNDDDATIYPGAPEIPDDGTDSDCDGSDCEDKDGDGDCAESDCDDNDATRNSADLDGDSYSTCNEPPDCDDGDPTVSPADEDGDGNSTCDGDCDDSDASLNLNDGDDDGGSTCDGDCDDTNDELNIADADGDGFTTCDGDCNDNAAAAHPGIVEEDVCNDYLDNDCDDVLDCLEPECLGGGSCLPSGFVRIPAGTFDMGSPEDEYGRVAEDESLHNVTLTRDFEIGAAEVTQAEFESVIGWNPSYCNAGCGDDYPVQNVSWFEAAVYANERSILEGLVPCYTFNSVSCWDGTDAGTDGLACLNATQNGIQWAFLGVTAASPYECEGYRLPTEAEWEYAARSAGMVTDAFPRGGNLMNSGNADDCNGNLQLDDGTVLDDQATYCGYGDGGNQTVGTRLPNTVGLYDISGNVYELCQDKYDDYDGTATDPWAALGTYVVIRGGSAGSIPSNVRLAWRRYGQGPADDLYWVGFRLARTLP